MPAPPRNSFELLYVDDEPHGVDIVRAAVTERNRQVRFNSVENPGEVLTYLGRSGKYAGAPLLDIIVLNLRVGDESGFELLRARAAHPLWRFKPLLVLSSDAQDVRTSYDLGVNACVRKPESLTDLADLVAQIGLFWCRIVMLPPTEPRLREFLGQDGRRLSR